MVKECDNRRENGTCPKLYSGDICMFCINDIAEICDEYKKKKERQP